MYNMSDRCGKFSCLKVLGVLNSMLFFTCELSYTTYLLHSWSLEEWGLKSLHVGGNFNFNSRGSSDSQPSSCLHWELLQEFSACCLTLGKPQLLPAATSVQTRGGWKQKVIEMHKGVLVVIAESHHSFSWGWTEQLTLSEVRFAVPTILTDPPHWVTFQASLPDIITRNF